MIGGSIAATGSIPSTLLSPGTGGSARNANMVFRDVDLSTITGTLLTAANVSNSSDILIENCKLGAAVAMVTGTPLGSVAISRFRVHNCDNGAKNYRFYENDLFAGAIQQETTIINNAGATDLTQRISWNIATTARANFSQPFSMDLTPICEWGDTTGSSKTATIEIAGSATLTNADIWMELEYPGSSASPLGSVVNCRAADILATPANVTTSAASWGGSPASTQKLQVTFTPQMKGWIKARIFVAKPSITVYIDPLLTVV